MTDVVGLRFVAEGERDAIAAIKRYTDAKDRLKTSILDAASKVQRVSSDWDRANRLNREGVISTNALRAAQVEAARQLAILNGYVKSNGALNTQRALAELRALQATREAAAADAAAAANKARLTQSYNQLLASIDPVIARQQRTRQTVDMLRAAVAAGAITTAQAARALNQYRNSLRQMEAANQIATRGMNRLGVITQQAGYQVGDFVVQIQSGTNVMVALGQQATQLIGTFAMLARTTRMIAIFSGLGVVVPILTAIGAAMMRTSGASDTLEQKLQKLEESGNKLETTLNRLEDTELDQKFGNLADEVFEISEAMLALDQSAQLNNLMGVLDRVEDAASANFFKKFFSGMAAGLSFGMIGAGMAESDEAAFQALGFDMARSQFLSYTEELQRLAQAGDTEGVVEAFNRFIQDATDNGAELSMTGIALAASMERSALATAEIAARLNGSAQAAKDAADAEKRRQEALRAGADAFAAHVAAYREEQIAAAEAVADQQAALLEENTRFEEEQARKRAVAQAKGDASRIAAINLYYDNVEKAEAERERVEAARAQIRKQRAEEEAALQKAMAQQVADQQAALLEENARFEQEQIDKRGAAEAAANERRVAAINLYYDNLEKAEAERERVEAARAAIRQQRAEEEAALQKAMAQQVADQQAALLEENARYEQEVVAKREQAAARHLTTQAAIYQAYADSRTEADALSKSLVEAYRAGEDLSSADVGAGVDAAAVAAAELARQMGISLSLAQGMVALGSGLAAPGGPDQARENVRNTYSGIAGLREEDIVARFTLAARDAPRPGRGGGGAAREQEDYLAGLLAEAEQKRRLVGLDEEETRRREILFELTKRELPLNDERIEQIIQAEAETRKLMEAEQQRQQLMDTVENHIQSAFMAMVDGSASVEDAFRNMLRNIILAIYEQKVAQPAAEAIGSLIETGISALFKADGGAFNRGVEFYANGGVVNAPTGFRHSGGLGVMGEAGPEAIMPLKRGKDGKLGVQAEGGGAVVVNNYFNMSANGDESVKRIIRGEMPRITEATKAAVVDAKRRGGSYGRSF